jgi:hypothetical protein
VHGGQGRLEVLGEAGVRVDEVPGLGDGVGGVEQRLPGHRRSVQSGDGLQRHGAGDGVDDDVAGGQGVLQAGDLEVWVGGGGVAGAEDDVVAGLLPGGAVWGARNLRGL